MEFIPRWRGIDSDEDGMTEALVPELYCRDILQSLKFYTQTLDFKIRYQRPEEKFAYLERESACLMLEQPTPASRSWLLAELAYPYGRGVNFQIKVTAVDDLYDRVTAAGLEPFLPLEEKWYRRDADQIGNRQFIVADPDGYLLRFFQDLGSRRDWQD